MRNKKIVWQTIYDLKTWLNIHVSHLNYTRNLVLTFSTALVAFCYTQHEKVKGLNNCSALTFKVTIILLGTSVFLGLYLALRQEKNYRLYRKISRKIEKSPKESHEELDETDFIKEQNEIEGIENGNKDIFLAQLWSFYAGVLLIIAVTIFD
jgi:hypothetical protein